MVLLKSLRGKGGTKTQNSAAGRSSRQTRQGVWSTIVNFLCSGCGGCFGLGTKEPGDTPYKPSGCNSKFQVGGAHGGQEDSSAVGPKPGSSVSSVSSDDSDPKSLSDTDEVSKTPSSQKSEYQPCDFSETAQGATDWVLSVAHRKMPRGQIGMLQLEKAACVPLPCLPADHTLPSYDLPDCSVLAAASSVAGQGSAGTVYAAIADGNVSAAKILNGDVRDDAVELQNLMNEGAILQRCKNKHLVDMRGFIVTGPAGNTRVVGLVTQLLPCSVHMLWNASRRGGPGLPLGLKAVILEGIAKGLVVMHSKGFCHGDVKLENVLLTLRPPSGGKLQAMAQLCDLGHATRVETNNLFQGGTEAYAAPEAVNPLTGARMHPPAAYPIDIYALAVGAVELFSGKAGDMEGKMYKDAKLRRAALLQQFPDEPELEGVRDFLSQCLDPDPQFRPEARDVADFFTAMSGTLDNDLNKWWSGFQPETLSYMQSRPSNTTSTPTSLFEPTVELVPLADDAPDDWWLAADNANDMDEQCGDECCMHCGGVLDEGMACMCEVQEDEDEEDGEIEWW